MVKNILQKNFAILSDLSALKVYASPKNKLCEDNMELAIKTPATRMGDAVEAAMPKGIEEAASRLSFKKVALGLAVVGTVAIAGAVGVPLVANALGIDSAITNHIVNHAGVVLQHLHQHAQDGWGPDDVMKVMKNGERYLDFRSQVLSTVQENFAKAGGVAGAVYGAFQLRTKAPTPKP